MSLCAKNRRPSAMDKGFVPCGFEAEPGRRMCKRHLEQNARSQREYQKRHPRPKSAPRPGWMTDPSLLPKRPPGAA